MAPDVHTLSQRDNEVSRVRRTLGTLGKRMQALGLGCGLLSMVSSVVLYTTGTPMLVVVGGIICGSAVGLLLYVSGRRVAAQGQVLQATLDGAMQASPRFTPDDSAEMTAVHASSPAPAPRPLPQHAPVTTSHQRESEEDPAAACRVAPPPQAPIQPLSLKAAAHAIGVTKGTMKGYIQSGRVSVNEDGTIDPAALSRAGFLIRN